MFLDRDGTIIVDKGYLADPAGVELLPRASESLRRLQEAGFALVVVSNQSGVGRGYYPLESVYAVNARMVNMLAAAGVQLAGVYFCPHRPVDDCDCRKPRLGMYRQACKHLTPRAAESWMIGDKLSDVEFGRNAGLRTVLLGTPGRLPDPGAGAQPVVPTAVLPDLWAVAGQILNDHSIGHNE